MNYKDYKESQDIEMVWCGLNPNSRTDELLFMTRKDLGDMCVKISKLQIDIKEIKKVVTYLHETVKSWRDIYVGDIKDEHNENKT